MKFISLGSGSCGNCYFLLENDFGIIIDMGIGLRTFKKHFREYGLSPSHIKAILITHDHTDHVKGVGALSQDLQVPVFATKAVHKGMHTNPFMRKRISDELKRDFENGSSFDLGPFHISTFPIPHDASDNCGYFIETETTNLCLMTDVGAITPDIRSFIPKAENLVIEANYDSTMLENGPYPEYLKRRIKSGRGHCSNTQTAKVLTDCLTPVTKRIWLCHLSEENNHPELARKTIEAALFSVGASPELHVLRRKIPSEVFDL